MRCPTVLLLLLPSLLSSAPLSLVENGVAKAVVVVSPTAGPLTRKAAELFTSRVERKTGAKLSVQSAIPQTGAAVVFETAAKSDVSVGDEGFQLKRQGSTLRIVAREGRGMLYGAGKILRASRAGAGTFAADPPLGIDRPAMSHRMLYLAIHVENYYEMQPASVIMREIVEDLALWGANGVLVWFDQSQYNDPFDPKAANTAAARQRWEKEKEVLKRAQSLGLAPGYTMSDNDLYRNQVTPEVLAPGTKQWAVFEALACPSVPRGRELTLHNKENLARELAEAGVKLQLACHFAYDTGGCRCERCNPWVLTFLKLSRDVHETFRKYHPAIHSYMADWHFTDEEAGAAIDFFNTQKPEWLSGIYKDDRHPADRFAAVRKAYPVLTFLEVTEIGGWGTVGANPFPKRLRNIFQDLRRTGQLGYVSYSEGIFDDFNKAAAIRLAWNPDTDLKQIASEYAGYHFNAQAAEPFAQMIDGMEDSWTNPMGSWGQQKFIQEPATAAEVERLARSISARLPGAVRNHWRWQVFAERAKIGSAIADLNNLAGFRKQVEEMARKGEPRNATRALLEAKRQRLEEYARLVTDLRNKVYTEPYTRYPPMIPGDWFMKERTGLDYAAWVQLFSQLSAVVDGVAKP
jgi:hypothetical protein